MKKNNGKKQTGKKDIPDLTSYFNPDMLDFDPMGSYTGYPADYGDEPVQDADDL